MKNSTLLIGGFLLLINIILGILLSQYITFNVCLNSVVIIVTTLLIYVANSIGIGDAFRISLTFVFAFIGLIEFVIGLYSKGTFVDNWSIIADVLLFAFEIIVILIVSFVSKSLKQ